MFKTHKRAAQADASPSQLQAANSSRGLLDIQRELIRVAFKDTVRNTGVPPQWLDCEVQQRPGPAGTTQTDVHLVIKIWSGHLLRYSQAFQHQLQQCLDRYEPTVDHSGFQWLWKFAPDCGNPFPAMPPAQEWTRKLEERKSKGPGAGATAGATSSAKPRKLADVVAKDKAFDLRDVFADL